MALVVDAAVTSKWVLQEADGRLAEALLSRAEDLFVPDFTLHQARNVLWVEVHRRTTQNQSWTAAEAQTGLHLLWEAVSPTPTHDKGLHTIALDIALAIDHSPQDCLYAAFAVAMAVDHLVVADGPFVQALRRHPDPGLAGLVLPPEEWDDKAGLA